MTVGEPTPFHGSDPTHGSLLPQSPIPVGPTLWVEATDTVGLPTAPAEAIPVGEVVTAPGVTVGAPTLSAVATPVGLTVWEPGPVGAWKIKPAQTCVPDTAADGVTLVVVAESLNHEA